ncbi:hypothetical protein [Acetilactobacillus jinshanensis]|uniref:Uncharacterized protein n=1 Tax=Acetilactobacillus jinshanensis TaxID=1720083 RepID=A0A4P6ZK77_9LACO|nr:hypothetical protein [Acetilactobacillus jinshanensis]QBP18171.1 hypothetical protein ELX58_03250 [Acetilactobacillus jinshanensis]URL61038.1 hypothetical protein HGK75_03310 [uncultured bacterium]
MSTNDNQVNLKSCEVDVPISKKAQDAQSAAGIKLLKANEKKYHLNIHAITSGGISTDDAGNNYASFYVSYQNK